MDHTLDVAISVSYTFLLLSLLCSALREALAMLFQTRPKVLLDGLLIILGEEQWARRGRARWFAPFTQLWRGEDAFGVRQLPQQSLLRQLMLHPAITALSQPGRLPSYIPSTLFARTLVSVLLQRFPEAASSSSPGSALLASLGRTRFTQALRAVVGDGGVSLQMLEQGLQQRFELTMERAGGWYKRRNQLVLFLLGLFVAGSLNINAIGLVRDFWTHPEKTRALADKIEVQIRTSKAELGDTASLKLRQQLERQLQQANQAYQALAGLRNLSTGWQFLQCPGNGCASYVLFVGLGWVMSAFAASLGAPFWFDGLSGLLALRGSGRRSDAASTKESQPPPELPPFGVLPFSVASAPPKAESDFERDMLTPDDWHLIHEQLVAMTGLVRQETRELIKVFQGNIKEEPTGELTPDLVRRILNV